MLTTASRDLATPAVDACTEDLTIVAIPNPGRGLLILVHGTLEVTSMKNDILSFTDFDHFVDL